MPKNKTHRGTAKRFKRTGTGKLKRFKAFKSHLTGKKSAKRIRNLRKSSLISKGDLKRIDHMIP
ncbi:MAG: 50S ribosomal protein L35 [Gallicola sp.]|uniref:50S ribosomal protein L35 n=1 Tax=Gallicola sp. Sow4_E12 TaxID=3438785 RepID=UPI001849BDC8|nr:50S ribosomal protein L35 [Gallicola sp.]